MFTGIVEQVGEVKAVERWDGNVRLWIHSTFSDLKLGESISVDGTCLTVTQEREGVFQCDVSAETQRLTLALNYQSGSLVNLERALRVGDRLGGHWVTGHVDTSLTVSSTETRGDCLWVRLDGVHSTERPLIARKGSVTLNGVSLTVNEVGESHLTVLLIPHTLASTNLSRLGVGSNVNVEWDWMAKVVLEALQTRFSEKKDHEHYPIH